MVPVSFAPAIPVCEVWCAQNCRSALAGIASIEAARRAPHGQSVLGTMRGFMGWRTLVGERYVLYASGAAALADVQVALTRREETLATGVGANALGGPVDAISWLLRLPGVEAVPAGWVLTTGILTKAFPIAAEETWRVSTSGPLLLGDLHLSLVRLESDG
jgi:hypothetical protein